MKKPEFLVLKNPGEFERFDAQTAINYEKVERKILPLLEKIIEAFENTNKERTSYTNNIRPDKEVIQNFQYGDVSVSVKTKPTTLKTNYKAVFEETENFLQFIQKDYLAQRQRKGVLTIENQIYINLNDAIRKIQELKTKALEGKQGISQEVKFETSEEIIQEGLEKVIFNLGKDYSTPTQENAIEYARAKTLKKEISDNFYNAFKSEIKKRTGHSEDDTLTETKQEFVRAGDYLFPVQVIPKDIISYAKIIDSLIKPFNKKITSNTGELIRLKEGQIDEDLKAYEPRKRDGTTHIRLEALMQKLSDLKEKHSTKGCSYKIERSIKLDWK
ncbi:MAG: hypothetical protein KKF46_08645 [Nanoarchaeota archaeon]|nr:hypothetical protein [Nanoarchaeota archaeon]MBU1322398.1 hypothetical protein [Nanoarchaeota archaeon]MBU1596927.1 hypothetical protein [Nanoarchaeota archaeon]MBU2442356.1 hypothetical protein [Nanoarchaeota archaeon]